VVVERQSRRRRHRVAARARRHAPQLGVRPVRVGEHGGAAGLGEQPAARRYAVEPRCGVALEGERRGPLRERAAGGGGGHGHALVQRGGQAVGPVVDDSLQSLLFVFSFQIVLGAPFAVRFFCDVRCRKKLNLCVVRLPLPLIHRISNNPILNPRDAGWKQLVVGINGKALFLGIQVLLDAVGILLGPFIGLAVSHKVIVG